MSMYSVASEGGPRGAAQQSTQVSTTTLLNAVHNSYLSSQPYRLDAGSSLVVNTWLTAEHVGMDGRKGGTVDPSLAARAWEHARRRAEDGCIVLSYVVLPPARFSQATWHVGLLIADHF
jgi:chitin synthase